MGPVERKIYFVRIVCPDDFAALLTQVDALTGADMYSYTDNRGGGVYLKSFKNLPDMTHGVFAKVRMVNLPSVATRGQRETEALAIRDDQGLAEETHFVYFKRSNLLAVEYNHFGPRVTTIQNHITQKIDQNRAEPLELSFQYLIDEDVARLLSDGAEVRVLKIAVPKERIGELAQYDADMYAAFDNARRYGDSGEVEIILRLGRRRRTDADSAARNQALLGKARQLASMPEEIFGKLRAKVKPLEGESEELDLLESKFVLKIRVMPRGRGRSVHSATLFRSIQEAYQQNHAQLQRLSQYEAV